MFCRFNVNNFIVSHHIHTNIIYLFKMLQLTHFIFIREFIEKSYINNSNSVKY